MKTNWNSQKSVQESEESALLIRFMKRTILFSSADHIPNKVRFKVNR